MVLSGVRRWWLRVQAELALTGQYSGYQVPCCSGSGIYNRPLAKLGSSLALAHKQLDREN